MSDVVRYATAVADPTGLVRSLGYTGILKIIILGIEKPWDLVRPQ